MEISITARVFKRQIAAMSGAQMREAMQNPEFVEQCRACGIPVLKGSWEQIRSAVPNK